MQKMLVCGFVAGLLACGGGGQKQAAEPSNQAPLANSVPAEPVTPKTETEMAMDKMRGFRDQFCACRDSACATKVSDDMTAWAQDMAKRSDEPPKMTEQQTKEMQQIGTQMGDCMVRAMQSGSSSPSGGNPCGGGP
jgi:hypothetical protein